jgi:hypothetical protein
MICAGPKNYAYRTFNPMTGARKTGCKVRGITLNYHDSQLVNFAKMKDMILSLDSDKTVIVRTLNNINHY